MRPPVPQNEVARLAALREHDILDTAPEQEFDDLVSLASMICRVPMALLTLVDEDRQWFKARRGIDFQETARDISFCAHAISQPGLFVVTDAMTDAQFKDSPLVVRPPGIRFYAGVPLVTAGGYALGTLCVLDRMPRQLMPDQEDALATLGRLAVRLLELRRSARRLAGFVATDEDLGRSAED